MPDFELARTEFERQSSVLITLLQIVDAAAAQQEQSDRDTSAIPETPPGGQNTMAAAALVLLAAHFEEYVRQQVQEYAAHMVQEYDHLTEIERERFTDAYWRGGTGKLNRIRPQGDPLWIGGAERYLKSLIAFPIDGQKSAFLAALLSEHENNMRWETITELSGRIGVRKLGDMMFSHIELREKLGGANKNDFGEMLRRKLNEFYTRRNEIVHSIAQTSGMGITVFSQWVNFFLLLANAFAQALEKNYSKFHQNIAARKGVATSQS